MLSLTVAPFPILLIARDMFADIIDMNSTVDSRVLVDRQLDLSLSLPFYSLCYCLTFRTGKGDVAGSFCSTFSFNSCSLTLDWPSLTILSL